MKIIKIQIARLLDRPALLAQLATLGARLARLRAPRSASRAAVPLPNALGLLNDHGIESLVVDPASTSLPFPNRYLLNVRRLGARPGLEMGIGVPATAITIDKLLVSAAAGCVQDVSTLGANNGTYWVVGRAAASLAPTGSLMEVPYVPCEPWQIINTGGTLTLPANPA